jgi:hypothetical protein
MLYDLASKTVDQLQMLPLRPPSDARTRGGGMGLAHPHGDGGHGGGGGNAKRERGPFSNGPRSAVVYVLNATPLEVLVLIL